jgi:hypothetical protein
LHDLAESCNQIVRLRTKVVHVEIQSAAA